MTDTAYAIKYIELIADRPSVESVFRNSVNEGSLVRLKSSLQEIKVHPSLTLQLQRLLTEAGILQVSDAENSINVERAKEFFACVDIVQIAKDYPWRPKNKRPSLYTSPPELIPQSMAADVDDIRNLLIELVSSTKKSLTILSPYTTASGLKHILRPLLSQQDTQAIEIKVYIANPLEDAKRQIKALKKLLPGEIVESISFFYRSDVSPEDDSILHAKILISDGHRGYLGSANFTSQGLEKHFELGIEMTAKQSQLSESLLEHLVSKKVFLKI